MHTQYREGHPPLLSSVIIANSACDGPVLAFVPAHGLPQEKCSPESHIGGHLLAVTNDCVAGALAQKPGQGTVSSQDRT